MLELRKLLDNVEAMSEEMARQADRYADLAKTARMALSEIAVGAELQAKIDAALKLDYTWRGAEPFEDTLDRRHRPDIPAEAATLIGVDGSQIYPDSHGSALYYLLNIGSIVLRQQSGEAPMVATQPTLYFSETDLYDNRNNLIHSEQINARRELAEVRQLAALTEAERVQLGGDLDRLIIAIKDGQLMMWLGERNLFEGEAKESDTISSSVEEYIAYLHAIQGAHGVPIGYVSRPRSANVIRLLWIGSLPLEEINRSTLQDSKYRALTDRALFSDLLGPNERSAIFVSTARANREVFAQAGQRICFFYLNVGKEAGSKWAQIARIDLPEWAAAQPELVDRVQNAIYEDCSRTRFPYVLARADELAVVTQQEKRDFEHMLNVTVTRRFGIVSELSPKAQDKETSRGYGR